MSETTKHFIQEIIDEERAAGKNGGRLHTRFPPEPNGYLHIGHAKAIHINFGLALANHGLCNLRFDDTNPVKEDTEYVDSIQADIRWLGYDWQDRLYFASDYFERLYDYAVRLIHKGLAYVCELKDEAIAENRGNFYKTGIDSPYRERSVEENLDLFTRMRAGEFEDGSKVLRAKIDMASPNMNMRDPVIYRIRRAHHHRTGDAWCIYPMYDFAHGLSDAIEGITHSLCSLEFEDHRPLYDWFLDALDIQLHRPRQIEFARLGINYTVMSKRWLLRLVQEGHVRGWDDPRMPTLAGLRRRGVPPSAVRAFAERVGVAKRNGTSDIALFESIIRDDLNDASPRGFAVLRPLKVEITNMEPGRVEWIKAPFHPDRPELGAREVPLTRTLYIEAEDYKEEAPRKWHRLAPGQEVRLRYGCLITCQEAVYDDAGALIELKCTWDPDSLGGVAPDGRKVRGTLHWLSAPHAAPAEIRLYDRLFAKEDPYDFPEGADFLSNLNPDSLEIIQGFVEPALAEAERGAHWQFERQGYFAVDLDSAPGRPVFNRTVGLRDSWARVERATEQNNEEQLKREAARAAKEARKAAQRAASAQAKAAREG
ncbi:glutamine--tRNA ligase/YqeY domain fusion protein [Myxococcota bacterium]|nr:glutamine--tRNA ligase/YqeY domain fusion protein [Myxococcota bacterium]MBU1429120.1 glutamine--tRNA ligase/YqeY domain fusion protein [Myxococcota bacterium]MBU1900535.1 glutamine--tRNA ligase/YqeY domain fusion protein [Myxococcota bacterium]